MKAVLADYGAGNLRSVCSALSRAGFEPSIALDPHVVREAPLAIIAGVGHVESAQRGLSGQGLDEALADRAERSRPVVGICVGLQLLFEESEEGGRGLGLLAGPVRRIAARRVPHMGWNSLELSGPSVLLDGLDGRDVYFAHSYAVDPVDATIVKAVAEHDGRIVAAVESGPLAGVQFHPERSGVAGARLLENVATWARSLD
ncbi:MAG TPA: imidazole glycerol phosphate synthase subunit HisH [Gaiellaceae bacterium]|nr:imidazole glycerol phosphate synthase subunit HisH [Gaiellaceae bacterium]